ncbi:MAG: MbcA/ParS/Xre antitoxin family protein [Gemmatimonadota bacterium]|nr:MbcA/ParS/Xre antitoxin family protein [Gemmatimonadota bacterium]
MNTTTTSLPGIDLARSALGLNYEEIARAVLTDPSTLYRWRQGHTPTAVYLSRLERLDELAREIQRTMRTEVVADWLERPVPAFDGQTPRMMILQGRGETVLGALLSLNYGFGG